MIAIQNLSLHLGQFTLNNLSFEIPTGEHGTLMGKTGSGKTSVLEAICGLRPIAHGRITLMGSDVTNLKPADRGIGYVPQDGALFRSMTVREHLSFALVIRKWPAAQVEERVCRLAEMLGLTHLLPRLPKGLSGGESQRVALGRALASHPPILCLDEPLSALDDATRQEMCDVIRTIRRETGVTILHVTHSLSEAEQLADRLFLLQDGGVIEQDRSSPPIERL